MCGVEKFQLAAEIVSGSARESAWQQAMLLACRAAVHSLQPDMSNFNVDLSFGKWNLVLALLRQQLATHLRCTGMQFNTAVSACERQDQWTSSLQVFEAKLGRGIQADHISFGRKVCADAGKSWPAALGSLEIMRKDFLDPSAVHCGEIMTAAIRRDVWDAALGLFSEMFKTRIPASDICLDLVIKACENAGQKEQALLALWRSEDQYTFNSLRAKRIECGSSQVLHQ